MIRYFTFSFKPAPVRSSNIAFEFCYTEARFYSSVNVQSISSGTNGIFIFLKCITLDLIFGFIIEHGTRIK